MKTKSISWFLILSLFFLFVLAAMAQRKTRWPELVGVQSGLAKTKILEDMPEAHVEIVPQDHAVITNFDPFRVWLFVDPEGRVVGIPRVG
ncbi:Subtilisin inhibitor 1 [Apostasia shenzhenica]|uniref:Subtilisin inhibitor 1 n=1 Tax=Apostasia shenzhenica TaxID=1088818 RepID=A0A2H9ZZ46_9ASPA|nr:Subtilisin inhibitor 1 [Apostasia shenzhenica]